MLGSCSQENLIAGGDVMSLFKVGERLEIVNGPGLSGFCNHFTNTFERQYGQLVFTIDVSHKRAGSIKFGKAHVPFLLMMFAHAGDVDSGFLFQGQSLSEGEFFKGCYNPKDQKGWIERIPAYTFF